MRCWQSRCSEHIEPRIQYFDHLWLLGWSARNCAMTSYKLKRNGWIWMNANHPRPSAENQWFWDTKNCLSGASWTMPSDVASKADVAYHMNPEIDKSKNPCRQQGCNTPTSWTKLRSSVLVSDQMEQTQCGNLWKCKQEAYIILTWMTNLDVERS